MEEAASFLFETFKLSSLLYFTPSQNRTDPLAGDSSAIIVPASSQREGNATQQNVRQRDSRLALHGLECLGHDVL